MHCTLAPASLLAGSTVVDNIFIAEYMGRAPERCVKAYLYGLMQCSAPDADAGDAAIALSMSEDELLDAFRYWQELGLVTIISRSPLAVQYEALKTAAAPYSAPAPRKYGELIDGVSELLGGRLLTSRELKQLYDWVEAFGLSEGAVLELVRSCGEGRPRVAFSILGREAQAWADAGVRSAEDARAHIERRAELSGGAAAILKRWRMSRRPTADELRLYEKWTREWGMGETAVEAGCAVMTGASQPSFKYLDAVLEGFRNTGAVSADAVNELLRENDMERELCRSLWQRAAMKGAATKTQREEVARWHSHWGMSPELLLLAAERASGESRPFASMRASVEAWHEKGVSSVSEARAVKPERVQKAAAPSKSKRRYTEEELKDMGIL